MLRVPFHERGRMTDEYLAAMIELWTSDAPAYHGTYVDFDGIAFAPRPVQQPHPPIWIGGNSRAAMRRAARHDGWKILGHHRERELPGASSLEHPRCAALVLQTRTRLPDVAMPLTTLCIVSLRSSPAR